MFKSTLRSSRIRFWKETLVTNNALFQWFLANRANMSNDQLNSVADAYSLGRHGNRAAKRVRIASHLEDLATTNPNGQSLWTPPGAVIPPLAPVVPVQPVPPVTPPVTPVLPAPAPQPIQIPPVNPVLALPFRINNDGLGIMQHDEDYDAQINVDNAVGQVRYAARGFPSRVRIDRQSGAIHGHRVRQPILDRLMRRNEYPVVVTAEDMGRPDRPRANRRNTRTYYVPFEREEVDDNEPEAGGGLLAMIVLGFLALGVAAAIFVGALALYSWLDKDDNGAEAAGPTIIHTTSTPVKGPAATVVPNVPVNPTAVPATPAAPDPTAVLNQDAFKGAEACTASAVPGVDAKLQQAQLLGTGTFGVKGNVSCNPASWTVTGVAGGDNGAKLNAAFAKVFVPAGTRIDDMLNSCDPNAHAPNPGIWGGSNGKKVEVTGPQVTGWVVPAETACPR